MAKSVFIRFLRPGIVKVEVPENFEEMTKEEKLEWASRKLETLSSNEVRESIIGFEEGDIPRASAIEEAEGTDIGVPIVETMEWALFCTGEGKKLI